MASRDRHGVNLVAAIIFGNIEGLVCRADDIRLIVNVRVFPWRKRSNTLTNGDAIELAEAMLNAKRFNGFHDLTRHDPCAF